MLYCNAADILKNKKEICNAANILKNINKICFIYKLLQCCTYTGSGSKYSHSPNATD